MNINIIRIICVLGVLWWPVSIIGATKHCGINKLPYDPNVKGCCLDSRGVGRLTNDPENADLEKYAEENQYCGNMIARGVTFCYNGKLVSVVCDDNWPQALLDCIAFHEEQHRTDPNAKCHSCESTNLIYSTKEDADNGDCNAYKKAKEECIDKLPEGTPGKALLLQEAEDGIAEYCS